MRISDWSSDVCSSDLFLHLLADDHHHVGEFVDEHDDEGQSLERLGDFVRLGVRLEQRVQHRLAAVLRVLDFLVEAGQVAHAHRARSEEHTSELQSLMRISYAVFCLQKTTLNYIIRITKHRL